MRLPRFRLRTLMIGVAVVALLLGLAMELRRRQIAYMRKAEACANRARKESVEGTLIDHQRYLTVKDIELRDKCYRLMYYYDALRVKYQRAARYPWFHVEPDSPEPR